MAQIPDYGQPFAPNGWGDDPLYYPPGGGERPGTYLTRLMDPASFGQNAPEPKRPPPGQWLNWLMQPMQMAWQAPATPGNAPDAWRNPVLSPRGSVPLPRPAAPGGPGTVWRGQVFPLSRDEYGNIHFDTEAGVIGSTKRAVMMPGRVLNREVDPMSDEAFEGVMDMAGLIGLGPAGKALKSVGPGAVRAPMRTLGEHSAGTFDPPPRPQRPFAQDYPGVPRADRFGSLTHDIDGDPLVARHVVGRQTEGGADVPLPPSRYGDVVRRVIGSRPRRAGEEELGSGKAGLYRMRGRANSDHNSFSRSIRYLESLPPHEIPQVIAHEMGHMIDDLAGDFVYLDEGVPVHAIPRDKLDAELKLIYNDLNNKSRDPYNKADPNPNAELMTPEHFGYQGADVFDEYMAEAVRAYIADPNYIKSVAPMTAAAIRRAVKKSPRLRRVIQFNASGVPIPNPPSPEDEGYWEAWKAGEVL